MLRFIYRCPPESHDRVANILVQRASMVANHETHRGKVFVDKRRQVLWRKRLGDGGEPDNVRKQDGKLLTTAIHAVFLRILRHLVDQLRRNVLAEKLGEQALGAGLHEISVGHVRREQPDGHQERGRQWQEQPAMRPDDIVQHHYEGRCHKRHQHGEQRAEGWEEKRKDNAADQEQDHLRPEHV